MPGRPVNRTPHAALIALLLGCSTAMAQTPAPKTETPKTTTKTTAPTVKPAPRTPVHAAPLVQPKPGATGTKPKPAPTKPGAKPPAKHPPAAAPIPVPIPVPTPGAEPPDKDAEPTKGSNTGNPLPRYATLRSDEVNLRTGPGTRYPIEWVYKRRDLPVLIEREFEVWRLVRDPEGIKGWVHQATLAPRRTGVVIGAEKSLRRDPKDDATPIARLKAGVIVRLRSCDAGSDWCQAQVQDYRGWIKRADVWGLMPGEVIQ